MNKNGANDGRAIHLVKDSFRVLEPQKQVEKDGLHRVLEFGHWQTLKQLKRTKNIPFEYCSIKWMSDES